MKKYYYYTVFLFVSLVTISCNTNTDLDEINLGSNDSNLVSLEMAQAVALNFSRDEAFILNEHRDDTQIPLRSNSGRSSQQQISVPEYEEKQVADILTFKDGRARPALYVARLQPSGYIIIPATKKEVPILGFSESGYFDQNNLPEALVGWLQSRVEIISYLNDGLTSEYSEEEDIEGQWDAFAPPMNEEIIVSGGSINEAVGPLISTTWGQGNGYNSYVPYMGCTGSYNGAGYALTGCVATTMAQIMRYWEYPNKYNWSIMPNNISTYAVISVSTQEVAKLMRDAGTSVNMIYGCSASSAYTSDAAKAFVNTFGYSSATYQDFNYSTIISNLNGGRPVMLRGQDPAAGGHAWICDGYKRVKYIQRHNPDTIYEYETYTYTSFYLHMNWGWDGLYDNWFYSGNPTPGSYDFSTEYDMVVNIRP